MPKEEEEKEGGEGRNPPIYYTSLYILFFKIRLLWPDQKKKTIEKNEDFTK